MQQHTGQHILSQAYCAWPTQPHWIPPRHDYVSIDLDRGSMNEALHGNAFDLANEIVGKDVEVSAWFPRSAEPRRSRFADTRGRRALRVVAIGDFDVSACGGTHVARHRRSRTGAPICERESERGTRVVFLNGDRARA